MEPFGANGRVKSSIPGESPGVSPPPLDLAQYAIRWCVIRIRPMRRRSARGGGAVNKPGEVDMATMAIVTELEFRD